MPKAKSAKKASKKKTSKKSTKRSNPEIPEMGEDELKRLQRNRSKGARGGGGDWWVPEIGDNRFRPIPFLHNGEPHVLVEQVTHFNVRSDGPISCRGEECAICALYDEVDKKIWDSIKASTKYLCNALVVVDGVEKQVKARLPKTVYDEIMNRIDPDDDEYVPNVLSMKKGRWWKISKIKTGPKPMNVKYKCVPLGQVSAATAQSDPVDMVAMLRDPIDVDMEQEIANDLSI